MKQKEHYPPKAHTLMYRLGDNYPVFFNAVRSFFCLYFWIKEVNNIPKMRATIKSKLAEIIPEWKDQVYDLPPLDLILPGSCAVVTFAEEVQKSAWAGYRRIVKIWPYARVSNGGFEQVEAWSQKLIETLHDLRLEDADGHAFTCIYLGASDSDRIDPLSGLVTRAIRFGVYVPEPLDVLSSHTALQSSDSTDADSSTTVLESVQPDSWLTALHEWTQEQLGNQWTVYDEAWPSDYVSPSVLWRLTASNFAAAGTSAFDVRKQWIGHVYGRNEQETQRITTQLVERLSSQTRIPLDLADRRYLTVSEASADLQADAFLNGQIRLTLLHRVQRTLPNAPLIREVTNKPVLDY